MLNENLVIEKKEGKTYPPLPKDIYQAELLDITSEERPTYDTRNKPETEQEKETVLSFQFTLLDGMDGEEKLRGRNVWANFVPTFLYIGKNGKNNLYRIIEALIGRELTQEEEVKGITGKRLNTLINKQCRISVEPKQKNDKTYDVITDWLKANGDLDSLTDEERENARVKKDDEKEESEEYSQPVNEEQQPPVSEPPAEQEVDVSNIPF